VPADGSHVWSTSPNPGKQTASESEKDSCARNRERDIGKRSGQANS